MISDYPASTDEHRHLHQSRIVVDVWTDLGCPWCYIGKSRLDAALQQLNTDRFEVVLHSYQLDPNASHDPISIPEIFTVKHGGTREQALAAEADIAQVAHREGLPFTTDRAHANTFNVHRVLQLAKAHGVGAVYFDALQRGFFAGELDPYASSTLIDVSSSAGVPAQEARDTLASDRFAAEVRADEASARALGVTAVPFLVIDGHIGVAGAQSVDDYARALRSSSGRPS